jgi:hypothetical protein
VATITFIIGRVAVSSAIARRPGVRAWAGPRIVAALATAGLLVALPVDAASGQGRGVVALQASAPRPGVEAYFLRESYRPGQTATLVVETPLRAADLRILRTGDVGIAGIARDEMRGTAVVEPRRLDLAAGRPPGRRTVRVRIGDWPTGVYYAELRSLDGTIGYAPFVLAPRRLGENRVAIVMPTNTWSAYNRRDADGDGVGDTWYEHRAISTVDVTRAYLDRGVPPNFRYYDLPFLRWLAMTGRTVDVLSQRELEQGITGAALARAYDLIVFPGHHEYVATREYDVVERFRDLGGNLLFLSANNYYWRVVRRGDLMSRIGRWRDIGRPEAALVGVQYFGNDEGERGPFILRKARANSWLFAGTDYRPGSRFADFGIEIDHTAAASPPGIEVLAEIPDLFGPGKTAQMTYYETRTGSRVFAAGAFTLAGSALLPYVRPVLENLWARLADG